MIEEGATHLGVATDHVIESFRNDLWPGYKTGEGIEPALLGAVPSARGGARGDGGCRVGDDRARGRRCAGLRCDVSPRRIRACDKVCIWTPDKDLAQCVRDDRIVQVDRKSKMIRDAAGVRAKFGVEPELIPDYLALVGDAADGYPGIAGIGPKRAASLLTRYGTLESFPPEVLGEQRDLALLFKMLATLKTDAALFADVEALRWTGPADRFAVLAERIEAVRLVERAAKALSR